MNKKLDAACADLQSAERVKAHCSLLNRNVIRD